MNILVITGDINQEYQVLDSIFAIDSHKEGFFFSAADPSKAFEGVKNQLRNRASSIGGDAVINCLFEYRISISTGFFSKFFGLGPKQVVEIFAYGTAVKRNQQVNNFLSPTVSTTNPPHSSNPFSAQQTVVEPSSHPSTPNPFAVQGNTNPSIRPLIPPVQPSFGSEWIDTDGVKWRNTNGGIMFWWDGVDWKEY